MNAIRSVYVNKNYLSADVTNMVIENALAGSTQNSPFFSSFLTDREREIVQLLIEGKTIKQIADLLFLSVKTVYTHRAHVMQKLDVKSTAELIKRAVREGLILPPD